MQPDVLHELAPQVRRGGEDPARNEIPFDLREPELHLIEPRSACSAVRVWRSVTPLRGAVVRAGADVTIVTYGAIVQRAITAANQLHEERGIDAYEDSISWGHGAEIAARIADTASRGSTRR